MTSFACSRSSSETFSPVPVRTVGKPSGTSAISAITPTHDGVQRGATGDDVGDEAALRHSRNRLQVDETGLPVVHPVRPCASVGDRMHAELTAGTLDADV